MSERKINLENIWSKYEEFTKGPNLPGMVDLDYFKPIVNIMICEGIIKALELASENAKMILSIDEENDIIEEANIDKQSILDIIKQVE